jgi:hypothetical protein
MAFEEAQTQRECRLVRDSCRRGTQSAKRAQARWGSARAMLNNMGCRHEPKRGEKSSETEERAMRRTSQC